MTRCGVKEKLKDVRHCPSDTRMRGEIPIAAAIFLTILTRIFILHDASHFHSSPVHHLPIRALLPTMDEPSPQDELPRDHLGLEARTAAKTGYTTMPLQADSAPRVLSSASPTSKPAPIVIPEPTATPGRYVAAATRTRPNRIAAHHHDQIVFGPGKSNVHLKGVISRVVQNDDGVQQELRAGAAHSGNAATVVPPKLLEDRPKKGPSVYDIGSNKNSIEYRLRPRKYRKDVVVTKGAAALPEAPSGVKSVPSALGKVSTSAGYPTNGRNARASVGVDDRAGKGLVIYLDWPRPSADFGLLNYRSLESWLSVYPAASVRCLLFAPQYALNYKFADILSPMQFQKYQKRGYDVSFELMHSQSYRKLWKERDRNNQELKNHSECCPGMAYFQHWSQSYWEAGLVFIRFKTTIHGILRFELRSFGYLARLWETGGVLADYTTLVRSPLNQRMRGVDLGEKCTGSVASSIGTSHKRKLHGWWPIVSSEPPKKDFKEADSNEERKKKPSKKSLGPRPSLSGPWANLDPAFSKNSADSTSFGPEGSDSVCADSLFMHFIPKDPILRCILEAYDDNLEELCDKSCLFKREKACRAAAASTRSPTELLSCSSFVDWRGCNRSSADGSLDVDTLSLPIIWAGPDAHQGRWRDVQASDKELADIIGRIKLHRWDRVLRPSVLRDDTASDHENNSTLKMCSNAQRDQWRFCQPFGLSPRTDDDKSTMVDGEQGGGAVGGGRDILVPAFVQRFTADGRQAPPLQTAKDEEAARFRCAPSIFVAGAMKGASTYLFNVLASHPQVLRPLEGAGFKEAGAYALKNNRGGSFELGRAKVHRFPFIDAGRRNRASPRDERTADSNEGGEPFVSADGSVGYMFESANVPRKILVDNPLAKVIFVVREPVERTWSDYRYLSHTYVPYRLSFAKVVLEAAALLAADDCLGLPVLAGVLVGASLDKGASDGAAAFVASLAANVSSWQHQPADLFYHTTCGRVDHDVNQIVKKSLYVFMIAHWLEVMGPDHILVLDSGDFGMTPSRQRDAPAAPVATSVAQQTFERVVAFAGLCPFVFDEAILSTPSNVDRRGADVIPLRLQADAHTRRRLAEFFAPYNAALEALVGRSFGWAARQTAALEKLAQDNAALKAAAEPISMKF